MLVLLELHAKVKTIILARYEDYAYTLRDLLLAWDYRSPTTPFCWRELC